MKNTIVLCSVLKLIMDQKVLIRSFLHLMHMYMQNLALNQLILSLTE